MHKYSQNPFQNISNLASPGTFLGGGTAVPRSPGVPLDPEQIKAWSPNDYLQNLIQSKLAPVYRKYPGTESLASSIASYNRENPEFVQKQLPLMLHLAVSMSNLDESKKMLAKRVIDNAVDTKDLAYAATQIINIVPKEKRKEIINGLSGMLADSSHGTFTSNVTRGFFDGLLRRHPAESPSTTKRHMHQGIGAGSKAYVQGVLDQTNPYKAFHAGYSILSDPSIAKQVAKGYQFLTSHPDQALVAAALGQGYGLGEEGEAALNLVDKTRRSARNIIGNQIGQTAGRKARTTAKETLLRSSPVLTRRVLNRVLKNKAIGAGIRGAFGGSAMPLLAMGHLASGAMDANNEDWWRRRLQKTRDWEEYRNSEDYKKLPTAIQRIENLEHVPGILNVPSAMYSGFRKLTDRYYGTDSGETPYGQSLRALGGSIIPDPERWMNVQDYLIDLHKKKLYRENKYKGLSG